MVAANENSALHTHYLLGTLPGRAPCLSPTVHARKQQRSARAAVEDPFLVRGDNGDPATPRAAAVGTSMSVRAKEVRGQLACLPGSHGGDAEGAKVHPPPLLGRRTQMLPRQMLLLFLGLSCQDLSQLPRGETLPACPSGSRPLADLQEGLSAMVTPSTLTVHRTRARVQSLWLPVPSGEEASRAAGIRRARPGLGYPDTAFPCPVQQAGPPIMSSRAASFYYNTEKML